MEKENQKSSEKPKKQVNYRKLFAIQSELKKQLKIACPQIDEKSGIYFLIREDAEENKKFFYIGKATSLISRMCNHLQGNQQRIDGSLKKRGFYSLENTSGWKLNILHFPQEELDDKERYYIDLYKKNGYRSYNIESGGTKGKSDINERKPVKGYYDGLRQANLNDRRLIAHLFDKHLDCVYKGNKEPNKNQLKAMAKFKEFINIEKEEKGENNNEDTKSES